MNIYFIYDLPLLVSFVLIVGFFIAFSLLGHKIITPIVSKWWSVKHDNNDLNSFYLSGIGVFYGITLGLIAAGAWENFQEVEEKVTEESVSIAALYRDCYALPSPTSDSLCLHLEHYVRYVIDSAWVKQRQGVVPKGGTAFINKIQLELYGFKPSDVRESNIQQEALRQFNRFIELRRLRLSEVAVGMPGVLWSILLLGAFVNILAAWMYIPETTKQGLVLNTLYAFTIGLMIYAIIILDNPFRGTVSVGPEAFEAIYTSLMDYKIK
ncbi:MAG: DUF4239 domain-containing protein [Cytophagaceae bacterium]|jgi:hypothetical protein|nr:DUF4239 domain-containing protein [Cytophagaceae bacterium]